MPARILVLGAPGNVGSAVVEGLKASGNLSFRIGAHTVASACKAFGTDLDIVPFDFVDSSTFVPAFTGIEQLFMVRPPTLANVKRDIAPALQAARQAGVKHVVFLSLQGVDKNRFTPHYKIEKLIVELGFTYTFLRAGFFMQNLTTIHRAEIRDRSEIAVPVGKALTSFIDVRDLGAVAVQALLENSAENKIYTLTGSEAISYYQVSTLISAVLERPIRYTNPNVLRFIRLQLAEGRPFGAALVMAVLYTITRFGNASAVTDDVQRVLHRPPISFRQFVIDSQSSWR